MGAAYLLGYLPLLLSFLSIAFAGPWSLLAPAVLFGVMPLIDGWLRPRPDNLPAATAAGREQARGFDWLIYATLPLQWALLLFFLARVSHGGLSLAELIGVTLSMGMSCGIIGINAGHELGHRPGRVPQAIAQGLLLSSLYLHFFIEHNRGHHLHVATAADPASAPRGQWVYTFVPRSIVLGWLSAWRIEHTRLAKERRPAWHNRMLAFQLLQVAWVVVAGLVFGRTAALCLLGAATSGIVLLEIVNYIEHYGLERQVMETGRPERVRPVHSWNSDHIVGRLLLFELTRHSDHHAFASRKYQVLRHHPESPQLPTGYPGTMLLALAPPLFFRFVHPRLDALHSGL